MVTKVRQSTFNWQTERDWRDMLVDAPSGYSPQWLGAIEDEKLQGHCRKLYIQLRRDSDNGNGVSLMRDLVLRRIVWAVRILERVEQAVEFWDGEIDKCREEGNIKTALECEDRLLGYMMMHQRYTKDLIEFIKTIMVEVPPLKTIGGVAEGDKVMIYTTLREGNDDN